MDLEELFRKTLKNVNMVHEVLLKTDIPDRVRNIVKHCALMDPKLDEHSSFAVAMTAISQLLMENKIMLKKEIRDDND